MVKLLDNIVVNNKEYTFVDSFLFKDLLINCYLGDEDYLFAFFKDKKEIFIDDEEIIKAIKEQEGLNIPEVYYAVSSLLNLLVSNMKEIPSDDVMEMINYFTLLIKKSGMMIDEEKILSKLSKVNFIEGQMEGCTGFYHPATNSIIVSSASDYSVMVHEMIHACGGRIYNVFSSIEGFIEGGTELTTRRLIGDLDNGVSSYGHLMFKSGLKGYQMPVAIVRQMEYLINDSVSESILLGKWDFFNNFKKKYGSSIYRFLKHRTTRMAEMKKDVDYCIQYFLETQKLLYETVLYG